MQPLKTKRYVCTHKHRVRKTAHARQLSEKPNCQTIRDAIHTESKGFLYTFSCLDRNSERCRPGNSSCLMDCYHV